MKQSILLQSLGKHIEALERTFSWAILVAIAMLFAGLRRQQELEVAGLKISLRDAFYVAACAYLLANLAMLIGLLRIRSILMMLDEGHILDGVTSLSTNRWLLNPFAFFGESQLDGLQGGAGFGLLILGWWFCFTSLFMLQPEKTVLPTLLFNAPFLLIGLASILAIQKVLQVVQERLEKVAPGLHRSLASTQRWRSALVLVGILLGGFVFMVVNGLNQFREALGR